ncbi:MAG: TRAP transporter substrate-binding protein [Burkholderiales bacterium]|nr:MAG: TRAP transporter substrate-binding protein [Burkholderiales bacterium]
MRLTVSKIAVAAVMAGILSGPAAAQVAEKREFAVVGTWGMLDHWKSRESKFWNETLPKASGGNLSANAKPLTELGMDGHKVMRDLKSGAFDFAHGVFLYVSADSPVIEGTDLPGMIPDVKLARKAMEAYKGHLNREFEEKFDSKILMLYAWDEINMFCKLPEGTPNEIELSALKGLKVRSYGSSISEFITYTLDATPVPVAFGEVLPSLQKGTIDCGVTGVLSGYSGKWWQVATHLLRTSLGYTASFLAVNNKTWNSLKPETRAFLEAEISKLENEMWAATERNDTLGLHCNTGTGSCPTEPGKMKLVSLSAGAKAQLKASVNDNVVQKWADRCKKRSADCVANWNATIGKLLGYEAR